MALLRHHFAGRETSTETTTRVILTPTIEARLALVSIFFYLVYLEF